jgi:hypothetical protein
MFFRKKKVLPPLPEVWAEPVKTIICIPGHWKTRDELFLKIIEVSNMRYMAAGLILMDLTTESHCNFEVCERDERMAESFRVAGMVSGIDDGILTEISAHSLVVYLTVEGGTPEKAEMVAQATGVILDAGGIGVKVESAGKAFTKAQWQELLKVDLRSNLYKMFVIDSITQEDGTVFSCGMHNLGLKDTLISGEDFQEAVDLIRLFSYYQLLEQPEIFEGQTFSAHSEAQRFCILEEPDQPYKNHELFSNVFGMWRLERVRTLA